MFPADRSLGDWSRILTTEESPRLVMKIRKRSRGRFLGRTPRPVATPTGATRSAGNREPLPGNGGHCNLPPGAHEHRMQFPDQPKRERASPCAKYMHTSRFPLAWASGTRRSELYWGGRGNVDAARSRARLSEMLCYCFNLWYVSIALITVRRTRCGAANSKGVLRKRLDRPELGI